MACEKKFLESHIMNSLLTKLVLLRWLNSGLTFLLVRLWTSTPPRSINTKNKNLANIQPSWPNIWSRTHKSNFHQILYIYMTCKPNWFWVENFIIPLTVSKQIMERKNLLDINLMKNCPTFAIFSYYYMYLWCLPGLLKYCKTRTNKFQYMMSKRP